MRLESLADDVCPHCGVPLPDTRHPLKKYCSDACRIGFRVQRDKEEALSAKQGKTCLCCGAPLASSRPSTARFCNRDCNREWHRRQGIEDRKCLKCRKPIAIDRERSAKYCCKKCHDLDRSMAHHLRTVANRPARQCLGCSNMIPGHVNLQVGYCSPTCRRRVTYGRWKARYRCEAV